MAKQARIEDIILPIFDGANYSSWKLRLLTLLEYKECHEAAIGIMPASDTKKENEEKEWRKKDLKARTIIMSTISDKQLEFVSECQTAYEMIKKFDKMYLTQSTAMQIICRGKIEEIRLNNYNTVEDFFVDFEKTINDFKLAGGKLDESEKLRYMLRALPPSYSYIGDFLDVIPEEQRTVDYVQSKIKEKNMTTTEPNHKNNVSTFSTKTKVQCFVCGKTGHIKKDCWHAQKNIQGQQSHQGRQNFNPSQRGLQRGRGGFYRGRSRGRGRGSGFQGESSNNVSSESWTAQVCNSEINQVTECTDKDNYSDNNIEINWLLDSGCTDHIINNESYFFNCIDLKIPVDVKLPDGKMLKATKVGTVKVYFKNYYNVKHIDLKNVYFVKGIKQNLLSFSKITKNCTIVARNENAKIYNQSRELVVVANKLNNLYWIKSYISNIYKNET